MIYLIQFVIKQYIVSRKAKATRTDVRIENLKSGVMQYFITEKHIANCNKIAEKFQAKWEGVLAENGSPDFGKIM